VIGRKRRARDIRGPTLLCLARNRVPAPAQASGGCELDPSGNRRPAARIWPAPLRTPDGRAPHEPGRPRPRRQAVPLISRTPAADVTADVPCLISTAAVPRMATCAYVCSAPRIGLTKSPRGKPDASRCYWFLRHIERDGRAAAPVNGRGGTARRWRDSPPSRPKPSSPTPAGLRSPRLSWPRSTRNRPAAVRRGRGRPPGGIPRRPPGGNRSWCPRRYRPPPSQRWPRRLLSRRLAAR
jgi:hypothetical protein